MIKSGIKKIFYFSLQLVNLSFKCILQSFLFFLENLYKSHCQFGLHLGTIRVKIKLGVWQMYQDGAEIRSLHKFFDLYQIFHCQTKKAVRESWAKCRLEWQRETFFLKFQTENFNFIEYFHFSVGVRHKSIFKYIPLVSTL